MYVFTLKFLVVLRQGSETDNSNKIYKKILF